MKLITSLLIGVHCIFGLWRRESSVLPSTEAFLVPPVSFPVRRWPHKHTTSPSVVLHYSERNDENSDVGLNKLHTLLRDAVQAQDFAAAGRISGLMAERVYSDYKDLSAEDQKARRRRMSWLGLGGAPWLADRLDMLSYTFPTTIQVSAFEAVNAILSGADADSAGSNGSSVSSADDADDEEQSTLEERMQSSDFDMGVVVSGATGSGKTLSYAVPLLSTLSDSLFLRQRLRVADEEAVGDTAGDLADRIDVVTSPRISSDRKEPRAIATGASISTLGRSGTDVKTPLALIVVPTRELGVQTAKILYKLVGGFFRDEQAPKKELDEDLEEIASSRKYKGPKGVRIGCVLDDEEAQFGLKLQTDLAITTPKYLGKLLQDGDIVASKLRVIVYDEADLGLEQTKPRDLSKLFDAQQEATRLTLLVGASVTKALGNLAVSSRILPEGRSYIATATTFSPLTRSGELQDDEEKMIHEGERVASLKDLDVCLYPGLQHERVVVGSNDSKLLVLTRLLRKELEEYENRANVSGQRQTSPRVVVFFPDEETAKAAIEPLRDALWGKHLLCVLLPNTGIMPLSIMEQFRKSKTSVMLATANSVRGLDFPALTSVYTLYLPIDDPREYLHLAGRVGRVGHSVDGRVISVLTEDEANELEKLASTLNFDFTDIAAPSGGEARLVGDEVDDEDGVVTDLEALRRRLEDTMTFVELAPDPVIDIDLEDEQEDNDFESGSFE